MAVSIGRLADGRRAARAERCVQAEQVRDGRRFYCSAAADRRARCVHVLPQRVREVCASCVRCVRVFSSLSPRFPLALCQLAAALRRADRRPEVEDGVRAACGQLDSP